MHGTCPRSREIMGRTERPVHGSLHRCVVQNNLGNEEKRRGLRLQWPMKAPPGHKKSTHSRAFFGAPAGIRTPDTLLKRQVLCLLSYWGVYTLGEKPWLGWRDSNPLYRSQSPVCYHYTTSQYRLCGKRPALPAFSSYGVGYGARTHDTRNHNPVLYQLS